ncbi:MAG: metallophosphoesterase [Nanoarchaeota archaeon]
MHEELLRLIKDRGLLLEKEIFDLLNSLDNPQSAKNFLEGLERYSGEKMITRSMLAHHSSYLKQVVSSLEGQDKTRVENTFITLGLHLEVRKEEKIISMPLKSLERSYQIFTADTKTDKKLTVGDFVGNFRARYSQLQRMLMQRPDLSSLMSIGKISSNRQQLSIIGMVREKRVTKNKNIIILLEDLTGEIQTLVRADKGELAGIAHELQLDDVIGIKGSGNRDMLFIQDIFFPDAFLAEKSRFEEEICIAFLSDLHCGSDRHLGDSLQNFIAWIRSNDPLAHKIKYLFFVGDNVDGVGIFPGQEHVLKLKSMKEQYALLASYLRQIPPHITMFMCPGQHDAVRVAEPQPIISAAYASELYTLDNLIQVTNPTLVKILEGQKEFKVLMYHGASIHTLINDIPELRIMKAHRTPAKAVRHMLKRRHLAPTHSSVVYIPNIARDPLVIHEVPDVLCTGEVHRLDIENYNGVLIITGSCWQAQTPFEEKVGNIPDPCKVPVLNLKTRELKILDFTDEGGESNGN